MKINSYVTIFVLVAALAFICVKQCKGMGNSSSNENNELPSTDIGNNKKVVKKGELRVRRFLIVKWMKQ
jgi:energy-converting hydrogenase Eha subunit H